MGRASERETSALTTVQASLCEWVEVGKTVNMAIANAPLMCDEAHRACVWLRRVLQSKVR